jgi:hypothetical protein
MKRTLILAAVAIAVFVVMLTALWFFLWRPARYIDPISGFSIRFTAEWEVAGKGEGAEMRAARELGAAQGGGLGIISVGMYPVVNIPDATAFRAWFRENFAKKFPGYARVQDGMRGAVPWSLFVHRTDKDDRPAQVCQYFYVKGNRGYVVSCTAKPHEFERFRADFEDAVDSFEMD